MQNTTMCCHSLLRMTLMGKKMANINLINVDKKYKPSHMEKQRDGVGEGGRQAGRDRTNGKVFHIIVFPSTLFVLMDVILAGKNCAMLTSSVCVMN